MTKETLKQKVCFILDDKSPKEMQLFGIKKNCDIPYKINVDQDFATSIVEVIAIGVKSIFFDQEYEVIDYSIADERKNRYYCYDLDEVPSLMKAMSDVIGNSEVSEYDLSKEKTDDLDGLIIVISNGDGKYFSIYKKLSSVEKIATTKKAVLGILGTQILKGVNQTLLRIGPSFHAIYVSKKYILINDKFAESTFKLHDVLKRQADRLAKRLEAKKIVYDIKKLKMYNERLSFCRKLVKILNDSYVLSDDFEKSKIFTFLESEPQVANGLSIIEKEGEKYLEINNKKDFISFLEILNDEFLESKMTGIKYKAANKDNR